MTNDIELEPNKARALKSSLEDISLDYRELLADDFVGEHSSFETLDELLQKAGWLTGQNNIDYRVTVGEADQFIEKHSDFGTWHQFLNQALEAYYAQPGRNRRSEERRDCDIPATIEAGHQSFGGRVKDISPSGVRVHADNPLPNVRTIKVHLDRAQDELVLRGAVRWTSDDNQAIGVEILSKNKE